MHAFVLGFFEEGVDPAAISVDSKQVSTRSIDAFYGECMTDLLSNRRERR